MYTDAAYTRKGTHFGDITLIGHDKLKERRNKSGSKMSAFSYSDEY